MFQTGTNSNNRLTVHEMYMTQPLEAKCHGQEIRYVQI